MHISLNWLKKYVDIDVTAEELGRLLTMLGLEIEAVVEPGREISQVFIGQILDIQPHPDAEKLVVCRTDTGGPEPLQIVCGAKNMKAGDKVPTAVVGATLPGGFAIGQRKMRGIESQGMMCSARELGMGEDHAGLLILDVDAPVGADAKSWLGLDDVIYEIEVTPNRGDWASMIGVARELAAYFRRPLHVPAVSVAEKGTAADTLSSVVIEDAEKCPRYLGRVLSNVKVGPSPSWLAGRLIAAGQRPINNVVDITNYVLLETGHPLHAFDYDLLAGNRIVVRTARPGENMRTLDGEERKLDETMLVIADAEKPQAVAGIMGGADSEVGEGTTRVFLESAVFHPVAVRRTARKLNLITEAAQHFQRGADPEMAVYALNRAAELMRELAGADIAPGILDAHPAPAPSRTVTLRFARSLELLGVDMPADEQCDILERLGFKITARGAATADFLVPSWRHDVSMETDLVEELARFYGYDRIPATLPKIRQSEQVFAPEQKVVRKLRNLLVNQGLTEAMSWTFTSVAEIRRSGLPESFENIVALQNPLTEDCAGMRTSLIPNLLAMAEYNAKRGAQRLSLFELGPVYLPKEGEDLPFEPMHLGILLAGQAHSAHWAEKARATDVYDLKGWLETVSGFFGVPLSLSAHDLMAVFQKGMGAKVLMDGKKVGYMGKVARAVLKDRDIPFDVFLCDIDISGLLQHVGEIPQFAAIPAFPASLRDLAVVVDRNVPAGTLLEIARKNGGEFLREVSIFDIYTGKPLTEEQKSVALSLVFQSPERTLTDKDTEKAMAQILKRLEKECGAVLR